MSRYQLLPKPGKAVKVMVGWDPPMETYFATVDNGLQGKGRLLWMGGEPKECQDLDQLRSAIAEWADIPAGIAENLARDRTTSHPPTQLQRAGLDFVASLRRSPP